MLQGQCNILLGRYGNSKITRVVLGREKFSFSVVLPTVMIYLITDGER